MKKIKLWIIVLSCIIVILFIAILILNNSNKENIEVNIPEEIGGEINSTLKKQQSPAIYFTVEKYMNNFFTIVEKSYNKQIYYLLNEDFIKTNEITIDNVLNNIIKIQGFKNFNIDEMYVEEYENAYSNYIKGTIVCENQEYTWYGLFEIDGSNYAIYPVSKQEYNDIIQGRKIIERKTIKANEYNEFLLGSFSTEDLCYRYYEDYINKLLNKPDVAYSMLDDEYKSKRFDNDEKLFRTYIEDKRTQLKDAVMTKYSTEYNGYERERIILKDNFDNYYIIKENAVLDYTIQLDNYTIKNEEFYTEYKDSPDAEKIAINLKEIIKMVNSKDYKHLYNKLNEDFRNNNFPNESDFKTYITNTYYQYNVLSIDSIKQERNNIYVCDISVKSGNGSGAEKQSFTIVMSLTDNNDYVLSFAIEN